MNKKSVSTVAELEEGGTPPEETPPSRSSIFSCNLAEWVPIVYCCRVLGKIPFLDKIIGKSAPVEPEQVKICGTCFEEGAVKRKCCNCLFCDHCYTKNKACPNCKQSTRKEGMTGATYTVQTFSEHEECRLCLEPGTKRRCCGNYYCDECFYKSTTCKSCDAPINSLGLLKKKLWGSTSIYSVLLGWGFAIFVIMAAFTLVSVVSSSEALTPVGIYGYKCYGFFRECTTKLCIDLPEAVANGEDPLPDITTWKFCDINSTVKLQTSACVFDKQLYGLTDSHAGYDPCLNEYRKGVYIMEDNFESWTTTNFTSNKMKSALWDVIYNGLASSRCGKGVNGAKSLTFAGSGARYAITKSLNIASGGWLEADVFFAPQGYDISHPECKTAYSGGIDIEYSLDEGVSWNDWHHFDAWEKRDVKFFHVELEFPPEVAQSSVRFRFIQVFFDAARDAWALDNVKVYRYLPPDWHTGSAFSAILAQTKQSIQRWQCCFDSDWCTQRLSEAEQKKCFDIPFYHGKIYLLRGAELYVCLCVVLNVIKFCYISIADYLIRKRMPFHDEILELAQVDWLMAYLPARYRPKKSVEDAISDVHKSARLGEELRASLEGADHDDGTDDAANIKKRKDILRQDRKEKKRAIRKEKKRLLARMKNKGYKGPGLESLEVLEPEIESDEENEAEGAHKFVAGEIATDADILKRSNIALLRIPFETKNNWTFRKYFAIVSITTFVIVFFYRVSTTDYYSVYQEVKLFGAITSHVDLTSFGINFFAFLCDIKEIYHVLKNVIPIKDSFIPQVTVDLESDANSLYVGSYTIPLQNITEFNNFSIYFMAAIVWCYFWGGFPWCMFSLLIRNEYLPYEAMRVVSPCFGALICWRAILGPAFLIKFAFSMFYFFDFETKARELVGKAMSGERSKLSANTTSLAFMIAGTIIGTLLYTNYAGIIFGASIVGGYIYGLCTGCMHNLPIKPWMYITTLEHGIWLRVQKKQRCPCIYWGSFCTEIHLTEEILVLYPTDESKFRFVLQGNVESTAK